MSHLPTALTVSASAGTWQVARGPAQAIRPSRITTTAFFTGVAPVPSTSVAPTIAIGGGGASGGGKAVVTPIFAPAGVRTSTRSPAPRTLPLQATTRSRDTPLATPGVTRTP